MRAAALIFSALLLPAVFGCGSGPRKSRADLVLLNGTVWTLDPVRPVAEAVAVREGRILDVGSDADIRLMVSGETEVIDVGGAFVLPGFIDSHTHFIEGGFSLSRLNLREARSREEFARLIAGKAAELGEGEWVLDGEWDHHLFDPPRLPDREWIDGSTPDNPVFVSRLDGHMALANSLALRRAGIDRETEDPPGGEIVRRPDGEPTGILKDAAMDLVAASIPVPAIGDRIRAARAALRHAASRGVTSVHDMSSASSLEVYRALLRAAELTSRVRLYIRIDELELFDDCLSVIPGGGEDLQVGGLKGFVDGSLGSATALFFQPYSDDPGKSGLLHEQMFPEGIMEERLRAADRKGIQVAVHAIGDRANALILDLFERVSAAGGPRNRRWRVEHAQHLRSEDIARFGRLGVVASVQPAHVSDDGRWAEGKIGPLRARTTYPFRSLLDAGAVLAFGSDWTVAPIDPLIGIYAAVTRRTAGGSHPRGWIPEERISLEEAIRGYTLGAAYAEFSESKKGSLEKGKMADLVVLDRNLFDIDVEDIPEVHVLLTIVGGRIVFDGADLSSGRPGNPER